MARRTHSRLFEFFTTEVWALSLPVFEALRTLVERHVDGVKLSVEEIQQAIEAREGGRPGKVPMEDRVGSTAVIPIFGVIAARASQVSNVSEPAGTSVEEIRRDLRAALADETVDRIVLHVSSPGGTTSGILELGAEIRQATTRKPIVALIESIGASAAYWLAAQADEIVATPSTTDVGSIGVVAVVKDTSRATANAGVTVHAVRSTALKGGFIPGTQPHEAMIEGLREKVRAMHAIFVEQVRLGRDVSKDRAESWATGETWVAGEALRRGLIDRIATVDEVLAGPADAGRIAAESDTSNPLADIGSAAAAGAAVPPQNEERNMTETKNPSPAAPNPTVDVEALRAEARAEAAKSERDRVAKILRAAQPGQEALAQKAIADGTALTDALLALAEDTRSRMLTRARDLEAAAPKPVGPGEPEPAPAPKATEAPKAGGGDATREKLLALWNQDPAIRAGHATFEEFEGLQRALAAGRVKGKFEVQAYLPKE